ncbi:MAG: M23 family metallopeptidase [Chthoniobacterales bacterium]
MRGIWFWILLLSFTGTLLAAPSQQVARTRLADGFDFPVGKPEAKNYYKARGFLRYHPGEDWNGTGGGNSDLGDPVYNIGDGLVIFARNARRGWGNVVIVRHAYFSGRKLETIDSFYAHLDRIDVREGQQVRKGDQVGTIGTNNGMYTAHLHLEVRKNLAIGTNRSAFKNNLTNYHVPTKFIKAHRKLKGGGRAALVPINTFRESNSKYPAPSKRGKYVPSRPRPSPTPKNFKVKRF